MQEDKHRGTGRALRLAIGLVLALAAAVLSYALWERAPEPAQAPAESAAPAPAAAPKAVQAALTEATPEPMPEGLAPDTPRQDGVFTVLLAGQDQISGGTDTILVCRLDSRRHRLDVVSLPRDTIINADWAVRKLNTVYAGAINADGNGADALLYHVKKLVGFTPDCYAVLRLDTFMALIDCLGGVDYDVPFAMDFDDEAQRLYIHLQPGPQHLNGYQAMGLCRFRADYITGDLGRIEVQQDFMRACLRQFISLGSIPHAREALELLKEGLDTDLSKANMAWFMRQLLLCRADDIRFGIMPFDDAMLQGLSYAVPQLWDWLAMVNEMLNPYDSPVGCGNVDLIYRTDSGYAATGGLQGAWYFEPPPKETPPPEPAPEPEPEATPGPTIIEVIPGGDPPSLSPVDGEAEGGETSG